VETVAKVVGHVYPVWSHYLPLTFHTRFQRHPHIDQWFDQSLVFPNGFGRLEGLLDFPIGGFSPPEGRLARGFKPPAFSRFLFQSAVKSAESF
jgi:hypothetical protein